MIANFHSHTTRCHHATGTEREYIEAAIKQGIKILGFSDHTPQFFYNGYVSSYRMSVDEVFEYADTVRKLADEYKNDIKIYLGFETEYFPREFDKLVKLYERVMPDYLLLGQHATNNEYDGFFSTTPTTDVRELKRHVELVKEGLNTGLFSYLAHPDVLHFIGSDEVYEEYMTDLLSELKRLNLPAEFNFLGFSEHRYYPSERYLKIAEKVGNKIIFGIDAHNVSAIENVKQTERAALEFMKPYKLELTDKIKLLNGEIV